MKKETFMPLFKTSLLLFFTAISFITICYITTNNQNEKSYIVNEVKNSNLISDNISNIFTETNDSTKLYQTDIFLTNLTIKEKANYKITDFIQNVNKLPVEITYEYTLPEMKNYYLPGTYQIKITFKDQINNTLEKETNLTIIKEQKVNDSKSTNSSKATTNSSKSNKVNNKSTNSSKATTNSSKSNKVNNKSTNTNNSTTNNSNTSIETRILNDSKKLGSSGRIFFESLYSVALYQPTTSEEAQKYVDNKDSGAIIKYSNISLVADHASQGFDIIKRQKIGNYIYIKNSNKTIDKYVIKEKTTGYNTGDKLLTKDGRNVLYDTDYSLALYTCNSSNGYHVTILLLNKVN